MATQQQPSGPPDFVPAEMMAFFLQGRHDLLAEQFLGVFEHFRAMSYRTLAPPLRYYLNRLMSSFLHLFSQPEFHIPDEYVARFISLNRTISNLVALSSFRTTDPILEMLREQQANFAKILTLYSARNTVRFDRKALFDTNPVAAALWYSSYANVFHAGLASKTVWENLREHFAFDHRDFSIAVDAHEIYYGSTYVDGVCDRDIKSRINRMARQLIQTLPEVRNVPKPNKIVVISASWAASHPVYRDCYAYVKALKEKYHLSFFQLGEYLPQETSLFDEVGAIRFNGGVPELGPLADNDFQVVYFPDIGMSAESILLANMRLAPIQIASPGHSVSTFGAQIDYFISGADVEVKQSPEVNYSERLVLLKGMGLMPKRPNYQRRAVDPSGETITVACPWSCQKLNYPFVETLKELLDRARRPVKLRVFVGWSARRENDGLAFSQEIYTALGPSRVEVLSGLAYPDYMATMEGCHLSIDAYHFGGCNTISDTLFLGLPTITWEGTKWYNRIGSQMLRLVGFDEGIATDEEQYLEKSLRMIHDDEYRLACRRKLLAVDLDATLYNEAESAHFLAAVDHLIAHHEQLKAQTDRKPIYVG